MQFVVFLIRSSTCAHLLYPKVSLQMSRNNSRTGGLRYLWIPGRKKSHPKGRFDSTNKRIDYNRGQKPNEPWSLGGSKTHKNLLEADGLENSPSISGIVPATCAAAVPSIATATEMPALTENKFSVLAKIDDNSYQLPSPPRNGEKQNGNNNDHISASDLISDSSSNHNLKKIDEDLEDDLPSPPGCEDHHSDVNSEHSPHKKLSINKRRSYNNYHPEVDINSIESVSESKLQYSDSDITDGVYSSSHNNKKTKRKNKKNKKANKNGPNEEDDEKIVKCLYYTLMCCECTIS